MDSALLLFLSPMRAGERENYTGQIPGVGTVTVSGAQTNEAPCKYLIHHAAANRDRISTVLCIVSGQVMQPEAGSDKSAFDHFRQMLTDYLSRSEDPAIRQFYGKFTPRFIPIPYDYDPDAADAAVEPGDRATFIYGQIARIVSQRLFHRLYMDYTGGFRHASFLLTELSRFLNFVDIPCRQIAYSNYSEKTIISLKSAYEMFPILNGISNLINTGNADALQQAYATKSDPAVDALLEQLVKFARAVSLCATGEIDSIWAAMVQSIQQLEQQPVTAKTDITILMLRDFLPQIRRKFNIRSASSSPSYLHLVRWCMDNGMLQQAMTLFTEKIGEVCFNEGYLSQDYLQRSEQRRAGKNFQLAWVSKEQYALNSDLYSRIDRDPVNREMGNYCNILANKLPRARTLSWALDSTDKGDWSKSIARAAQRLRAFILANFNPMTKQALDPSAAIYDKTIADYGTSLQQFLTRIANESSRKALDYFVHNDFNRFCKLQQMRDSSKKLAALEILSENKLDVSEFTDRLTCRQLHDLMRHCYIIKLLRNQINHASDDDNKDYQYFVDKGIFDRSASLYELSREALENALCFFELLY